MKSLVAQGLTTFTQAPQYGDRREVAFTIQKNGRSYQFVARDQLQPEDPYFVMVKAAAFAIKHNEPYAGKGLSKAVKDALVRGTKI